MPFAWSTKSRTRRVVRAWRVSSGSSYHCGVAAVFPLGGPENRSNCWVINWRGNDISPTRCVNDQCCAHRCRLRGGVSVFQQSCQSMQAGEVDARGRHVAPTATRRSVEHPCRDFDEPIGRSAREVTAENRLSSCQRLMDVDESAKLGVPRI